MSGSDDSQPLDRDVEGSEDLDEDPGEELEAVTEQADRPVRQWIVRHHGAGIGGRETLEQRLGEERPSKLPSDRQLAIELGCSSLEAIDPPEHDDRSRQRASTAFVRDGAWMERGTDETPTDSSQRYPAGRGRYGRAARQRGPGHADERETEGVRQRVHAPRRAARTGG